MIKVLSAVIFIRLLHRKGGEEHLTMKTLRVLALFAALDLSCGFCPLGARSNVAVSLRRVVDSELSAMSRSDFFQAVVSVTVLPQTAHAAASYSSNARNLDRINAGDFSGGSVYDNNPSAPASRRRRAMQGCKIPVAREEAAEQLAVASLQEKDCNVKVMQDSPDFMLKALQILDCPTCPYGVKASRD